MSEELIEEILSPEITNLDPLLDSEMIITMNNDEAMDSNMFEMLQQTSNRTNPSVNTPFITHPDDDDEDDFIEDETILERIIALKEMFPESIQNAVGTLNRTLIDTSKSVYSKGRSATWWYA